MFVIFANHLRKRGFKVYTNCNNMSLLNKEGESLAEYAPVNRFPRGVKLIIIGGGCLFKKVPFLRLILSRQARMFEREISNLQKAAEKNECAIHMLSVGSDDSQSQDELSEARRRILNSPQVKSIHFRLKRDMERLPRSAFAEVFWEPDILLRKTMLSLSVDAACAPSGKFLVGINLHRVKHRGASKSVRGFCIENAMDYKFVKSVQEGYRQYEYVDNSTPLTVTPSQDKLRELSKLNVVISNKLHIGIVAISLGVPFISYAPQGKTLAQMQDLGLDGYCFNKGDFDGVKRAILLLQSSKNIKNYFSSVNTRLVTGFGSKETTYNGLRGINISTT